MGRFLYGLTVTKNSPEYVYVRNREWRYINKVCLISLTKVVYDRGFVEVCEVCHVVCEVELWWIDLVHGLTIDNAFDRLVVAPDLESGSVVVCHPSFDERELV